VQNRCRGIYEKDRELRTGCSSQSVILTGRSIALTALSLGCATDSWAAKHNVGLRLRKVNPLTSNRRHGPASGGNRTTRQTREGISQRTTPMVTRMFAYICVSAVAMMNANATSTFNAPSGEWR